MKPLIFAGVAIIVVLAIAILGVGLVFAQQPGRTPLGAFSHSSMMGNGWNANGMMGGTGMMGGYSQDGDGDDWMDEMHQWMTAEGGMHTLVWERLADKLGLTTDQLKAELSNGKTLAQVADQQGVSQDELTATLEAAARAGLEKAVSDGILTQEQADAMLAHMSGNFAWMLTQMGSHMGEGFGQGHGDCHGNDAPQDNT